MATNKSGVEAKYWRLRPRLARVAKVLQQELAGLTRDRPDCVMVMARVKSVDSFRKKAAKKRRSQPRYPEPLVDIQDLIGCRVVVRGRRAVSAVVRLISSRFDPIESGPAGRYREEPAYFGYEGHHLICPISIGLRQRHGLGDIATFEVQVSTVFQLAWAEMDHDLNYKNKREPLTFNQKRRVAAAAALASTADSIFAQVSRAVRRRGNDS